MINSSDIVGEGGKKPILLAIDDKPENLFILQQLIEEYLPECKIEVTTSADEAYEIISKTSFDGILVDVQMPGVNGIEFCQRLKTDINTAHIPVILITAHKTTPELKAEGLKAGADDFISKPIDNIELVAKIKVILRIKKYEDELKDINKHLEEMVQKRTAELTKSNEQLKAEITERKKAEEKLVFQASLLEQVHNGVIALDSNNKIIYWNKYAEQLYQWKSEEVMGKDIVELLSPKEMKSTVMNNIRTIQRESHWEGEFDVKRKDGSTLSALIINTKLKDINGKNIGIIGISTDITERKQADKALIESEEQYRLLFNSGNDALYVHQPGKDKKPGKLIEVNDIACKRLLYTREELLKLSPLDFSIIDPNNLKDIMEKLYADRQAIFESMHVTKEGRMIPVEISAHIFEFKGIPTILSIARDITERKQLEEERTKASKLESIGILAGGIAHDFNNILAVIMGNTSLAKMSLDNKSEVEELLSEVEKASIRAKDLTQQLLTFAKGGAPVKEVADISEIIDETAMFSLRGSKVKLCSSVAPDLWPTIIDKGQISQVISNLVINAQQAMPEGGNIDIKAENVNVTSEDKLTVKNGKFVKLSIIDKGHGIPVEHLSKIFDPYFTTKQKGSGLGLATTYSIIHRHNGHIAVKSEDGSGTTFHIYLPASSKQLKKKESAKKDTATTTGKILVMDDDKSVRKVIIMMLKGLGNEADEAIDGTEAIELYKKAMKSGKPYDLVIMDLTIPGGMGGKEAIQKLLEINSDVKAIVSSGYANDRVIANYQDHGFKGYIAKPYKYNDLIKVLNKVLP